MRNRTNREFDLFFYRIESNLNFTLSAAVGDGEPSKYRSRRVYTEATPLNVTDNTETTTVVPTTTTPKFRKFTFTNGGRKFNTTPTPDQVNSTTSKAASKLTTEETTTIAPPKMTTLLPTESLESNSTTTESSVTLPNCGVRDPDSNIHPWIVVLEHSDELNSTRKRTLSKGVLISDRYVLTTVSSIHNSHPFWEV